MATSRGAALRCPQCRRPVERARQHDDRDVFDPFDRGQTERRRGVAFCPHEGCGAALVVEVDRRHTREPPRAPDYRQPHEGLVAAVSEEQVRLWSFAVFTSVHRLTALGYALRLVLSAPLLALLGGPRSPLWTATELTPRLGRSLGMGAVLAAAGLALLADGTWARLGAAYPQALDGLIVLAATAYGVALVSSLHEGWLEVVDLHLERRSMQHLRDRREVYVELAPVRPSHPPLA